MLGYWKTNNTQKRDWAKNNREEGEEDRNAKVIMERKREMIFHTFSDWSCGVMIMFTCRLGPRFGGKKNIWWLLRCSSLLLVTCMNCLSVLILCQRANHLVAFFYSWKSCDGKKCVLVVVDWSYGFFDNFIVFNKFLLNFHRAL